MVYTFERASETLGKRDEKKVGNNTYLMRKDNDTFVIRLHGSTVVEIHRDGSYGLFTRGYHTHTTKARINEYSPACISQVKGEWIVNLGSRQAPFVEGIRVDMNGCII